MQNHHNCVMYASWSQDAFILDTGAGGIFAWLGKKATKQEKKAAFKNAVVSESDVIVSDVVDEVLISDVILGNVMLSITVRRTSFSRRSTPTGLT